MQELRQGTSVTVKLGPFVNESGESQTSLTITQSDIRLSKNGADFAQKNDSGSATHDEYGWYDVDLDTTDTGTLGRLLVAVYESGALHVWREFAVVSQTYWDAKYSTGSFYATVTGATAAGGNTIADRVLRRTVSNALASADGDTKNFRSLVGAVCKLVNKIHISGSNLLVYEDDDSTQIGSQVVSVDADADPIVGLDTS